MSVSVIGDSAVKSFTFPAMVAGVISSTATGINAGSQLVSIVRNSLGGTAGVPAAKFSPPIVTFTGGPPPTAVVRTP